MVMNMQYIKIETNGKTIYKKPSNDEKSKYYREGGYKSDEKKAKKNNWYFYDLNNISGQIWQIGQNYLKRMQDPKTKPRHKVKNHIHLLKLFYFCYLKGCRQQEVFKQPYPQIKLLSNKDGAYVEISHVNEKHEKNDIVNATIPIFNEAEKKMWAFITDNNQETRPEIIFGYSAWESYKNDNISKLFNNNFKTTLVNPKNPTIPIKGEGIIPHILRHTRTYVVIHVQGIPKDIAQTWFGWDNTMMVEYYLYIRQVLQHEQQLKYLTEKGFLNGTKEFEIIPPRY
jgi:hypothetical protein